MMNNPIGVLITYRDDIDLAAEFRKAQDMGLESCQLCIWNEKFYTAACAAEVVMLENLKKKEDFIKIQ